MSESTIVGGPQSSPEACAATACAGVSSVPAIQGQPGFTVLVVEGNAFFRDLLQDVLRLRFPSLALATATTIGDALVQIDAIRPDLIFLDVRLADADGFELTRRIQQSAARESIIFFTGVDFPDHRGEALRSCADHSLGKGTAANSDIVGLVESAVASRALR
jgi:CheY-like chemotaxis protein